MKSKAEESVVLINNDRHGVSFTTTQAFAKAGFYVAICNLSEDEADDAFHMIKSKRPRSLFK
ncbi:hypothetical protein JXB12_05725 [candidate division KSB1 bacterium]|nr:hypothetical protein [candidate division KSB1 bacterium]